MQTIAKVFGDLVALKIVNEEYDGLLVPTSQDRMYMLSHVLAVGPKVKGVKVGEVVLWQWNGMIEHNSKHRLNNEAVFVLHELDLLARTDTQKITLDSFHILGDWCLLRREVDQQVGRIILPGNVDKTNASFVRYYLEQIGDTAQAKYPEATVGSEVLVERGRANPLSIQGLDYAYVQSPFLSGIYGNEPDTTVTEDSAPPPTN